jgi:hypothetical protein
VAGFVAVVELMPGEARRGTGGVRSYHHHADRQELDFVSISIELPLIADSRLSTTTPQFA